MIRSSLLAILLCVPLLQAAPVKLHGQGTPISSTAIAGKRDKATKITATDVNPKAGLIWRYDDTKLDIVDCKKTEKYFVGPPGTYKIEVWSVLLNAKGETEIETSSITLIILKEDGTDPVVPPKPDDPKPPKPVDPIIPSDPLVRSLQDAYNQDKEPDKATLKAAFAKTFRYAQEDAVLDKAKSTAALFDAMEVANAAAGIPGKITATKAAVGAYLKTKVPGVDYPLTKAKRDSIKVEFTKIADSLDAVK